MAVSLISTGLLEIISNPMRWKCKKPREPAIPRFPGGIFADIKGGRTSGHHDRQVTPSSEVFGAGSI
jgi:hypothetical protein